MTKIVQISDIHWRGLSRHEEYTDSFERLFDTLRRRIQPDLIINTGDFVHTKTQNITPEVIEKLSWVIRSLADIAPTITILGNHDGNLSNNGRLDAITPIHEAVNHKDAYLFKTSGQYPFPAGVKNGKKFALHVYSAFDEHGWKNIKPVNGLINLALFHGSISGAKTDMNYTLAEGEKDVSFFKGMDFALLGDIHKQQFLAYRLDKQGHTKPWIGYPGSLIQQNFGESEKKGFLVWDIKNEKEWDVEFVPLENRAPFITTNWDTNVQTTLKSIQDSRLAQGSESFLPGTRYRIISNQPIQQVEARQLLTELKDVHNASEVIFKYDIMNRMDTIHTDGKQVLKTNLRTNPDALVSLYNEFIEAHKATYVLNDTQLLEAAGIIKNYLDRLNQEDIDNSVRDAVWTLTRLEFDNILRYGENNVISFKQLNGIIGIFGPNKIGKSSIIAALMYVLFNTTDRGPLKAAHIINKNKNRCGAKLFFNVAGDDYIINRETIRNIPKKGAKKDDDKTITSLSFHKVEKDGSLTEMNSITRDETDREIRKLIGQPQDFLMTALSNQGGINKFIEEGATQRKAILSRFLDLDVFDKLNVYAKDDFSGLNEKTKKYSNFDWSSAMKRIQEEIVEIEKKIASVQENVTSGLITRDDLRLWILQHKNDDQEANVAKYLELKAAVEKDERSLTKLLNQEYDITSLESELEQSKQIISELDIEGLNEKLNKLDMYKSDISERKQSYSKELQVLEQQKKSIKRLEMVPCGDEYPTCHFIKDSHQDKKLFEEQELKVLELNSRVKELEDLAEPLIKEKLAEAINKHRTMSDKLHKAETALNSVQGKIQLRDKEISIVKTELEKHEQELKAVSSTLALNERKEYDNKKLLLDALTEDMEARERELRDLFVDLGGKNEKLKQLTKERSACRNDLEKIRIYETVQQAFSKNGIPSMVLKAQLPAINMELSKILGNIVDFTVSLETDISSNTMDVYLEDRHSTRIIELASGMEKMICSLALRVALINLSSLSRPDIFIIDEGWGTLDAESTVKCMELLTIFKAYFKTILVITHVDAVKEVADLILEIHNNGIESKVDS